MKIKKIFCIHSIAILSLIFTNSFILGAGGSDDENSDSAEVVDTDYVYGKKQAYIGNFKVAISYLEKSIEKGAKNADVFNMLGYSNRKLGKTEEAFKHYKKALKLDPRHRGTHEYIGKLYLYLNQPEKAKIHLDKLDSICFFGCDEYTTLKKAIEDYKNTEELRNY
tara:strand:- start:638 stop:1135 length:498 start_codon:yes stop_codon:yes gene_type:complete